MDTTIKITKGGHTITGRRYTRGSRPYGRRGGQQYVGYVLQCTCGWSLRSNQSKRPSESRARTHLRYHGEATR